MKQHFPRIISQPQCTGDIQRWKSTVPTSWGSPSSREDTDAHTTAKDREITEGALGETDHVSGNISALEHQEPLHLNVS